MSSARRQSSRSSTPLAGVPESQGEESDDSDKDRAGSRDSVATSEPINTAGMDEVSLDGRSTIDELNKVVTVTDFFF